MNQRAAILALIALLGLVAILCACGKKPVEEKTADQAANLPNIPLYPSGKVLERAYSPDGSFQVRMLTSADRDDIIRYYQKRLGHTGWKIVAEVDSSDYLLVYQKGKKTIHISLLPTEDPMEIIHVLNYKE